MILSASQQELIRTRPQSSRLYLSVFQPTTVFASRTDNTFDKGMRAIDVDDIFDTNLIKPGMLLLVGTSPGASDVGKVRIRYAQNPLQIVVGENSIPWQDNLYVTAQKFWRLDPIFPRIIQNPSDDEDVIFYKDYDIPYTNQNSILGTFVNMGGHRAALKSGSAAQIFWSSTGTYNLLGDTLNYSWLFEGGTPTGSTSANPGLVTYNNAGHFVTSLVVSGSSGGIDTSYRYVSIYDKPGEGSNVPILAWEMTSLNGSRDEGGWKASFKVHENINITENAVVVVFTDDWYGSTNQSLGGNHPGSENILFAGYVLQDSIEYDYKHSQVSFEAGSLTEVMKTALGFSVSVESVANPTKWYQLYDMDCRRAIYHYLRWHTTAMSIADFQFAGSDNKIQFFDADRTSMFDAIDNLMRNTLLGQVVSDRQGKVWMEIEAKAYTNPTGSFTSVMNISKRDWRNEPVIDERLSDDVSFLELGGVAYTGVNQNTFSALIASAPGTAPSFRGKVDTRTGLALSNQADLNTIVGNVWANDNSKFPRISMDMSSNLKNLDIAPQEVVFISIQPSDTVRNNLIEGLYIPAGMNLEYDAKNAVLLPSIDFTNLINGNVGDTVNIPISPADAGIDTGFSVPGLQIPPLPILTVPPAYTGVSTPAIQAFQQAYGKYARQNRAGVPATISGFRSMTLHSVEGISDGSGHVEFGVQLSGLYFLIGTYYQKNGDPTSAVLILEHSASTSDYVYSNFSSYVLAVDVIIPGTISTIFQLIEGETITFQWSTNGIGGSPELISFNAFRISN